ncbi:UvrD-helicase domain-containing protein [Endozoicomonas acroporae]|uniref:UvrD-helicase domain-containing protein n=1 Tax=Endozoicomonas acroporae TaxID=1701104 RepID=UPI003D7979BD
MSYLTIDEKAVKELLSTKNLQTADFIEAKELAKCIKQGISGTVSKTLKIIHEGGGLFLISKEKDHTKTVVFNLEKIKLAEKNDSEIVTILQKSCRLAVRVWGGMSLSSCEKNIAPTKSVVFPFPFSTARSYKLALEKRPYGARQEKRQTNHLLYFWDGFDQCAEEPTLSCLRKSEDIYFTFDNKKYFANDVLNKDSEYIQYFSANPIDKVISPHMGFDYWKSKLSQSQKDFIFTDRLGPDRLQGPAGTGKTLSLVLRAINQLGSLENQDISINAIFFTHSIATKEHIETLFQSNGGESFLTGESKNKITITTLQEWCLSQLGNKIHSTEYLDKDAMESKNTQLLYILETIEDFKQNDFAGAKDFISRDFSVFIEQRDNWEFAQLLQHEISVYIKGRSREDLEAYKLIERSNHLLPVINNHDYSLVFQLFNMYQEKLVNLGQFDSDDITITALTETSSPIWKRRRLKSGYDVIYLDETHLFNLNELSVFHNILRKDNSNIVFTIDKSQAVGDSSLSDVKLLETFKACATNDIKLKTVFRCSSDIINIASCILASGATLFTSLENPLENASDSFTIEDDQRCLKPYLKGVQTQSELSDKAYQEVDSLSESLNCKKSEILIVPTTESLLGDLKRVADQKSHKYISIEKRGDFNAVESANKSDSYIIGGMDYIGGLEFIGVVIVGADKDKLPPLEGGRSESSHFLRYSAFNRLYVAVTRAKYALSFLYNKEQGCSEMLQIAIDEGLINIEN